MEVHVRCSLETCMERDEKGIYEKAPAGRAATVPGLQVPYEPPKNLAAVVNTEAASPQEGARRILARLKELSFLRGDPEQG